MHSYKRLLFRTIGCLFICFVAWQCREEFPQLVLISTDDVVIITAVSARAVGTISDLGEGVKHHGFCWGTQGEPDVSGSKSDLGPKKESGVFAGNLADLNPKQKYYVRAYASDGSTVFYGETKSFTTQDFTTPVVQTGIVDALTPTSASVSGNISDLGNGITLISQHGHCWSTGPAPIITDDKTELGSTTSTGEFVSSLSGLQDSTNYYVRAYATNEKGISYGSVTAFQTPGYFPVISADTLEMLSATSVKISSYLAYLGPDNLVAHHGHCWATHDQPGIADNTTDLGSKTSIGLFFSTLSDLSVGEIYYVTSYATNGYGTSYGMVIPFIAGDPALFFINDPNLVAYFPFSGSAEDLGPLGIDGTINGALFTTDRNGMSNSALSFDGDDDWVNCGDSNRGITNTITISLWIKTSDSYSFIISKYNTEQVQQGYLITVDPDGYLRIQGRDSNSGDYIRSINPSNSINDSNWHHVFAVIESNLWRIWGDGVLEGTASSPTSDPDLTNGIALTIGSIPNANPDGVTEINGVIDDVLIFNRALTTEEMIILLGSKR